MKSFLILINSANIHMIRILNIKEQCTIYMANTVYVFIKNLCTVELRHKSIYKIDIK